VTTARGEVEVKGDQTTGKVYVLDKIFQGEINLKSNASGTEARIAAERAVLENIFPLLEVDFPLRGATAGNFIYKVAGESDSFEGEFSSSELYLLATRIEKSMVTFSGRTILLSYLQLHSI